MPINIWIGGTLYPATIRWYKAPANAKQFPLPTVFFSHVDDSIGDAWPGEPGELGSPRTFDHGANPGYQGQCYIGDPQWFLTGQLPISVLTPPAQPSPCLCSIPPAIAAGGLVLGGSARVVPATGLCSHCPGGAPLTWQVQASGGTGLFAHFNKTQSVPYNGVGCEWSITDASDFLWDLIYAPFGTPPGWQLRLQATDGIGNFYQATYSSPSFDCLNGGSWTLFTSGGPPPGSAPPTVAIAFP